MIVEENASLRSMIRSLLELGHADVAETSDSSQTLGLYTSYRPDWVLIDLSCKDGDGIELSKRLRKLHPEARVMLVTDLDSLTLRQQAREAGIGGILVKENLFRDLQRSNFELHENVRMDLKG